MVNMAKKACKSWWAWLLAIGSLVLVAFLNVSPIYIILCVLAIGFSVTYIRDSRNKSENDGNREAENDGK